MGANWPFLRPLGIAAGGLGSFQAITWGILSLLGILLYAGAINRNSSGSASNKFLMMLVSLYFDPNTRSSYLMTPETVVMWTYIYFGTSVIWLVISGVLLHDSYKSKTTSKSITGWVAFSTIVVVIDFICTVAFGVEYIITKNELDNLPVHIPLPTERLLAPIFMMTMCARGFTLWIMNVGLVIYLGATARKLRKKAELSIPAKSHT